MILDNKYYIKYYQKTINNIYVPCVCSMIYLYIIDYGQNNIYRIDISIDNFTNKYKENKNKYTTYLYFS